MTHPPMLHFCGIGGFFINFKKALDKVQKIGQVALKTFLRRLTDEKLSWIFEKYAELCNS